MLNKDEINEWKHGIQTKEMRGKVIVFVKNYLLDENDICCNAFHDLNCKESSDSILFLEKRIIIKIYHVYCKIT